MPQVKLTVTHSKCRCAPRGLTRSAPTGAEFVSTAKSLKMKRFNMYLRPTGGDTRKFNYWR